MKLKPIPYSELRTGFYWGRHEENGSWWLWSIFHVDVVGSYVEIRDMWRPELKPIVCGKIFDPPAGTGTFLYARAEPPKDDDDDDDDNS